MYHRTGAQRSFLELVTPPTNHTHNNYSMTAAASETTQDVVCVCVCVHACVRLSDAPSGYFPYLPCNNGRSCMGTYVLPRTQCLNVPKRAIAETCTSSGFLSRYMALIMCTNFAHSTSITRVVFTINVMCLYETYKACVIY